MPKIIFVDPTGSRMEHEGAVGISVMQVAVQNSVPGILAECGGAAACATCAVTPDAAWADKIPAPGPVEESMLEPGEPIRLSCQIRITPELDGLVVHVPGTQY